MATFTNKATLSYNGVTTVSNTVTGEIVGALSVSKTALQEDYSAGSVLAYVIGLVNSGQTDITGLTVTDDLGAYEFEGETLVPLSYESGSAALFVNGEYKGSPDATDNGALVFTNITVPASGSALIVYKTEVNGSAPLSEGSVITNTAFVTGARIAYPVEDSANVGALTEAQLSIVKSICPATVMENGALTYTFVIENTGGAAAGAEAALVVSDTFSPVLTGIVVTLDGSELTSPADYTYDESTGEFATTAGRITVPAAEFTREPDGTWGIAPGRAVLTVSGSV